MNSKFFKICNIVFELKSECQIADSTMFSSFRSEPQKVNKVIEIYEKELPDRNGKLIKAYSNKELYESNGKQVLFSFFPEFGNKKIYYSCSEKENNSIHLTFDFNGQIYDSLAFGAIDFPEILLENNCFLFHCSFIIVDGKAILFSGDSGKGKSTQADLWNKYRNAEIINGDKAILKIENGKLIAYGTPYCGSSKISVNKAAEVAAIIFPEHSKANSFIEIDSSFAAIPALLSQLTIDDQKNMEKALSITEEIFKSIPIFNLPCVPDETAVETAENKLKSLGII